VDGYLRRGVESGLEMKALGSSSDAIGGYAVPEEIDAVIDRTLTAISPIRAIANVVKVGSAGYRKLVTSGGTPSGWVGFEAARPETNTPGFTEIVPASGELYANPAASQQMLDDAMFDVETWLANEIATEFARAEGMAFVKGTGVNQPLGFLSSPNATTADGVRPMGTLQTIGTGAAGAFPGTNPADKLVDLVQTLRAPYRQGAVFVMNSSTLAAIRKFKTADGAFLFQPSLAAGTPATLLGYSVVEAEDMPDVAAGSLSIAFGNFKAGYVIAERNATTILRDPFTHKPYVHFYATQLAEYGNRIPLLTFELIADEYGPTIGAILNDAGGGAIASTATDSVVGYAAYGSDRAASVRPLVEQFAVPLFRRRRSASNARVCAVPGR